MTWHADPQQLAAYARGEVDPASGFSLEAHLAACGDCQALVARAVELPRLERVWDAIEDRLDSPRRGPVEALLARLGVPAHVARLLAATPSLTASWLLAVVLTLAVAVAGVHQDERGLVLFLCLAALFPLAGVAAAFGAGLDPTYEIGLAAPLSSLRLLLLRTIAVLATTLVVVGLAALALPGVGWTAAAWLLPSLALCVTGLALATYVSPLRACAAVAAVWIGAVVAAAIGEHDRLAAFGGTAQVVFGVLTALGVALLVQRHDRLDLRGQL
jgi:putative zinc finger protein